MEKQYIRGNIEKPMTECKNCNKVIVKNSPKQIVYFCSKQCRKQWRNIEIKRNSSKHTTREFVKTT